MTTQMGSNRYGKSGIRLAVVNRDSAAHRFVDLEIDIWLHGDFDAAYVAGDNAAVLTTDTMRGTCYALARDGVDSVADYGMRVGARLLEASAQTHIAVVTLVQHPWQRVPVPGSDGSSVGHDHTFSPAAGGKPIYVVTATRKADPVVVGGVQGARVAKTTGSAFSGFLRDQYTTLGETRDRIMATTIDARWGTTGSDVDHGELAMQVPPTMLAAFAEHDDSESVQHTLYVMGQAVLTDHPDLTWIRFVLPNEHHIESDLSPYGLDNPGVVYLVADRPFGVIEGVVARDGITPPPAW
ncbi:urate oxidase [soil metagenome]